MSSLPISPAPTVRHPNLAQPSVAMSSRSRWGACALSAVLPSLRTPSGPAAEEGTAAHLVAEWALQHQFGATTAAAPSVTPPVGLPDFDSSAQGVAAWQASVAQHAADYAAHAAVLFGDAVALPHVATEQKIEGIEMHGVRLYVIADAIISSPQLQRVVVGDYKYGRSPVGMGTLDDPNPQVAGTLAVLDKLGLHTPGTTYGGFVYQPRARDGDPWQVLAPLTLDWVHEQRATLDAEIAAVSAAARAPDQTAPTPGEHCRYCPSARWCPAAADFGHHALNAETGVRSVADLTPAEVMAQWSYRSAFKAYEDDLRERVRILAEQADPAVTVQRRRGSSMWSQPSKVAEMLLLSGHADLLRPPGIEAVRAAGVAPETLDPLITRAPDVLTYKSTAPKDLDAATNAFSKYLPKKA